MGDAKSDTILSLEALESCTGSALRALYAQVFHRPPPPRSSAGVLRGNIAWAIQGKELKKDPDALRSTLVRAATKTAAPLRTPCRPGTRLIREWHGTIHEVMVLDRGYFWNGKTYRSLTRITREITGTNWSGPRFFGMRSKRR